MLGEVLGQIGYSDIAEKIKYTLDRNLPLISKELDVSGRDLMQLGYKGREIGRAQMSILQAIHSGRIENSYDDIVNFLKTKAGVEV